MSPKVNFARITFGQRLCKLGLWEWIGDIAASKEYLKMRMERHRLSGVCCHTYNLGSRSHWAVSEEKAAIVHDGKASKKWRRNPQFSDAISLTYRVTPYISVRGVTSKFWYETRLSSHGVPYDVEFLMVWCCERPEKCLGLAREDVLILPNRDAWHAAENRSDGPNNKFLQFGKYTEIFLKKTRQTASSRGSSKIWWGTIT